MLGRESGAGVIPHQPQIRDHGHLTGTGMGLKCLDESWRHGKDREGYIVRGIECVYVC